MGERAAEIAAQIEALARLPWEPMCRCMPVVFTEADLHGRWRRPQDDQDGAPDRTQPETTVRLRADDYDRIEADNGD